MDKNFYKKIRKLNRSNKWKSQLSKFKNCTLSFIALVGFQQIAMAQTPCIPSHPYGCYYGDRISNVTLQGESVLLNNSTQCSTDGYGDYTSMNAPDLAPGMSYDISVTTDYASPTFEDVRIWIDYNDDGVFDSSEEIGNSNGNGMGSGTVTYNFSVPTTVSPGTYTMRVRLVQGGGANIDPCGTAYFGETEDYSVVVQSLSGCNDAVAGTISSTATEACSDEDFTLSASGMTGPGNGLTYQWQESPAGANTWTDIAGANSSSVTINGVSDDTDYRLVVECSFGNLEDISNVVTVNAAPATECYCEPTSTYTGDYISGIEVESGMDDISYSSSSTPNNPSQGYDNQSAVTLMSYENDAIEIETTYVGGANTVRVWVDWNQNGMFETNELVVENNVSGAFNSLSFSVPGGTAAGDYRMRIRGVYDFSNMNGFDACSEENYGSAVDFTLTIITLADCTDADAGTISSSEDEVCSDQNFVLSTTGNTQPGNGLSYQWQESPAGQNNWTDIAGANGMSATINGVSDDTDFRLVVECSFGNLEDISNVITVNVAPATDCYCEPEYEDGCDWGDVITNVTLIGETEDINNSSQCSANGYGDYTNLSPADLIADENYSISVTAGSFWPEDAEVSIWVDWNQNGVFEANEEIGTTGGMGMDFSGTEVFNFTVPANTPNGLYRMRVRLIDWPMVPVDPCDEDWYGEAEDYMIEIVGSCEDPIVDLGPDVTICEGETVTLDAGNSGLEFEWSTNETTQSITVSTAGTYTVTVTDGDCSTTASITVDVQDLPVVDLGADTHICEGETITLDAGNPGADYEWNDNSTGQTLDVTSGGTYSVTVTEGDCSASDEIVITELPAPSATGINANNAFDCLFGFSVTNPQNVDEYIWDFGDGSPAETTTNPDNSHNYGVSGTYTLSVTLVNDCAEDVVITKEVSCDDGVSVHELDNAKQITIYPNPAKDQVTIEGEEGVIMEYITIYNVVGQKVFEGKANSAEVHSMEVSQFASGMYTVRIETQNGIMIKKFEIVK